MLKNILCWTFLSVCLYCFQSPAFGQRNNDDIEKIVIDSIPRNAYVEVSGEYSYVGRTPFSIPYALFGRYKIKAQKSGYETYNTVVNLSRRGAKRITLRLFKKTPGKAAYRSLLLPGWGQLYGQSKFKGLLVGLTQVSLGVSTYLVLDKYSDKKNDYQAALDEYDKVRFNFEEADLAFAKVQQEYSEAKDYQNFRNIVISLTAGFWLYNILDSVLFFSRDNVNNNAVWQKSGLSGQIMKDEVRLSMKLRF